MSDHITKHDITFLATRSDEGSPTGVAIVLRDNLYVITDYHFAGVLISDDWWQGKPEEKQRRLHDTFMSAAKYMLQLADYETLHPRIEAQVREVAFEMARELGFEIEEEPRP